VDECKPLPLMTMCWYMSMRLSMSFSCTHLNQGRTIVPF